MQDRPNTHVITNDGDAVARLADPAAAETAGELSQADLRRVAETVRAAFPRSPVGCELVLIDVDPRHLHAFWSIPLATAEAARSSLDPAAGDASLVLRVSEFAEADGSARTSFDIEVLGLQGQFYLDIWSEARRYGAVIGLRQGSGFVEFARSNGVELPPLAPSPDTTWLELTLEPPPPEPRAVPQPSPTLPATEGPRLDKAKAARGEDFATVARLPGLPAAAEATSTPGTAAAAAAGPGDAAAAADAVGAEFAATIADTPSLDVAADQPGIAQEGERVPDTPAFSEIDIASTRGHHATLQPSWVFADFGPVARPFPLPIERSAGVAPLSVRGSARASVATEAGSDQPAVTHAGDVPEVQTVHSAVEACLREDPVVSEGPPFVPLPVESGTGVSSFVLGRDPVDLEINAELHIFGRAKPGSTLQLFGRPVALRPDGTFSIYRPLPDAGLLLSTLLSGGGVSGG